MRIASRQSIAEEEAAESKAAALAAERRRKDAGSAALETYKVCADSSATLCHLRNRPRSADTLP